MLGGSSQGRGLQEGGKEPGWVVETRLEVPTGLEGHREVLKEWWDHGNAPRRADAEAAPGVPQPPHTCSTCWSPSTLRCTRSGVPRPPCPASCVPCPATTA